METLSQHSSFSSSPLASSPDAALVGAVPSEVPSVLSWGTSGPAAGQGDEAKDKPARVRALQGRSLVSVASRRHTLLCCDSGAVYSCGVTNDCAQLGREGHEAVPRLVSALEAIAVVQVAVGDDFSLCLSSAGAVFGWGKNDVGQLGTGTRTAVPKPRLVKGALQSKHVVRIAAGRSWSLLLALTGELFGCGDGHIGNGDVSGSLVPARISHVFGAPIVAVAAGEAHSLALTVSGALWSWGSNAFGQLGDAKLTAETFRPNTVALDTHITAIAAGAYHSVVCTAEGRVVCFGQNTHGQLGLGSDAPTSVMVPRVVTELLGTRVLHVSAGRRYSWFMADSGRVLVAGGGRKGPPTVMEELQGRYVVAGDLASFATLHAPPPRAGIVFFDEQLASGDISSARVVQAVVDNIEASISIPAGLNGSFLDDNPLSSPEHSGVDLARAIRVLSALDAAHPRYRTALASSFSRLIRLGIDQLTSKSPECLRLWLLVFAAPSLLRPSEEHVLIDRLLVSLVGLNGRVRSVLESWWVSLKEPVFRHVVNVLQRYVSFLVTGGSKDASKAATAAVVLDRLHDVRPLTPTAYYNTDVSERVTVEQYLLWSSSPAVFTWLKVGRGLEGRRDSPASDCLPCSVSISS